MSGESQDHQDHPETKPPFSDATPKEFATAIVNLLLDTAQLRRIISDFYREAGAANLARNYQKKADEDCELATRVANHFQVYSQETEG